MSDVTKWACDYCTYQNYPAAKKCTLCHVSRPRQIIGDDSAGERDIYKVGLHQQSNVSSSNRGVSLSTRGSLDRANKWSCSVCTYLNWPHYDKCIQCDTPRLKTPRTDVTEPLSINTDEQMAGSSHMASKSQSPSSPDAAKDANNDINRARCSPVKWSCNSCTYDNWLQATKCVMCGSLRTRNKADPVIACGGSNMYENESNKRTTKRRSPPMTTRNPTEPHGATAAVPSQSDHTTLTKQGELRLKLLRKRLQQNDWLFLGACNGILDGDLHAIESYLHAGGDPTRQLTSEDVLLLNRSSAFEVGFTLIHLAIRFKREDILALLLTTTDVPNKAIKRLPSHVSPTIVTEIRREISTSLRQRKEIEDLDDDVQKQLFDELLDRDVQNDLESEESVINWSVEVTDRLGSRLYALWNRTAGDCLLDSVLQASWGVLDIDATLRHALSDSLSCASLTFYPRWREFESVKAQDLHFMLDEAQWHRDWAVLLAMASQPGASLEQTHIFTLAHIFRRPIIVYGVKYVKSFRGETIGYAGFQGLYLPLLWEQSFCYKTPIALGYTRGHFSALVAMETDGDATIGAQANIESNDDSQLAYLPLIDNESKLLPVHFLTGSEILDHAPNWHERGIKHAIRERTEKPSLNKKGDYVSNYHTRHAWDRALNNLSRRLSRDPPLKTTVDQWINFQQLTVGQPKATGPSRRLRDVAETSSRIINVDIILYRPLYMGTIGREEDLMRRWLDCIETKGGILVAIQRLNKRPAIVKQMTDEWLDHYRQLTHNVQSLTTTVQSQPTLSSDGESDDE